MLVQELFAPLFHGLPVELVVAAGFDSNGRLLSFHGVNGSWDRNPALPLCVRAALSSPRVTTLMVAHNHPVGPASPSEADLFVTRRMATLCRLADARLADHLIFAGEAHFSFRVNGLL